MILALTHVPHLYNSDEDRRGEPPTQVRERFIGSYET
jgi:hypothetical protein